MGLEEQKNTLPAGVTRGANHRGDFGRMMTIVVDQKIVVRGIDHLEAPPRTAEAAEAGRAFGHVETQLGGQSQHRGRIDHVVLAGNIQGHAGQLAAVMTK